jgi:hypothetical protein
MLVAPSEKKREISDRLKGEGAQVIDFRVVEEGCQVGA